MADTIHVQVCYAKPNLVVLRDLEVVAGTRLEEAIAQSGVLQEMPEIDLTHCKVGIYGKIKSPDTILRKHDRVEIYRPLIADPKEARRRRVAKKTS